MKLLALALSFLPAPAVSAIRAQDVEFARVQEEWIFRSAPRASAEARIPALVRQMGSSDWRERESAHKAISAHSDRYFGALITAERFSRDAEIRWRCAAILDDYCVCRHSHDDYTLCPNCENSGDVRYARAYDSDGSCYRVSRDLFSPTRITMDYGVIFRDYMR